jgi:pimeloyl-ACP methyl ester carboxylesterase
MTESEISYLRRGNGPPVVLVHGFPLDGTVWQELLENLSPDFSVIVPDLPGFGKSPSQGPFTMESMADVLQEFLKRIGVLPCVLAGLSMGGYIAQAFAVKYSSSLRGLMLVDTRCNADTDTGKKARNDMIELAKSKGSAAVAEQMMPKMFAPGVSAELVTRLRAVMTACPAQTIQYASAAMRDRPDLSSDLAELSIPALIIVGEFDVLAPPSMAQEMHGILCGSTLTVIPNAGHMTPMERPADVAASMRKFLSSIPNLR